MRTSSEEAGRPEGCAEEPARGLAESPLDEITPKVVVPEPDELPEVATAETEYVPVPSMKGNIIAAV